MFHFPASRATEAELRAGRVLRHGVECGDGQLLQELWCALRDAENDHPPGAGRDRLTHIREEVGEAIAAVESESMRSGPTCGKEALRSRRAGKAHQP